MLPGLNPEPGDLKPFPGTHPGHVNVKVPMMPSLRSASTWWPSCPPVEFLWTKVADLIGASGTVTNGIRGMQLPTEC